MHVFIDGQATSFLDEVSKYGGIIASLAAIAAILVSIRSYRATAVSYAETARAMRHGHMHALFRDYLGHTLAYGREEPVATAATEARKTPRGRGADQLPETAVSIRLYVLEEMYAWTEAEREALDAERSPADRVARKQIIDNWRETILVHASYDFVEAVENLSDFRRCYSLPFMKFLRDNLDVERVLATWAGRQFRDGRRLDLGPEEMEKLVTGFIAAEADLRTLVGDEEKARRSRKLKPYSPAKAKALSPLVQRLRKRKKAEGGSGTAPLPGSG